MKLIADHISKFFGEKRVLKNITFELNSGQCLAVVGPNGSGKTTLLRILSALIPPSSGKVQYFDGQILLSKENIFTHTGFLGPYLELYDDLTAEENLNFFSRMRGLKDDRSTWWNLMDRVGLGGREEDAVKTYSSGMKQRLKYVFALMHQPEILFVDEPRSNLDMQGIQIVYELLREQKSRGMLLIATNEEQDLAFADFRVAVHD